ncbi:MAG: pectate lyase [Prevotella sp.]|nr:pectate lyase [Prevotella sp.]
MRRRTTTLLIALTVAATGLFAQKKSKRELHVPMDYSTCGYHASERTIPMVPETIFLTWQSGDCSPLIQAALDQVASQKADKQGLRGAVVLGEGSWRLERPLRINASGVTLCGMGRDKTILTLHGPQRGAIVYVEGNASPTLAGDTIHVVGTVKAGSTTLTLDRATLHIGDRVLITRPCTREWIDHLAMGDFGGGLDYTGWKPTDIDITWNRTVVAISGNAITLDAPVTTTITPEYGGAFILRHSPLGELSECGVEDLTLEAAVNDWNAKDEDHCWDGVFMEHVRDSWVRRVGFRHLAGSAVNLQKHTIRITVEDCIAKEPVSEVGGWRRNVFLTRGQQCLFQRCVSRQGIHDFSAGYCAAGPNAFVQCEGEEALGFSGSTGSWAAGLLFDIVNIDGHDLRFANLEQFQFGTGWNTANSMFWQCTASTIECYSPDSDNRCSAHGCWGTLTGNGEWTSSNDHVSPRSLYYDQLQRRLSTLPSPPAHLEAFIDSLAHILPRSTNATTSPTVEQAMEMAQESLHYPRLTMEMWIDSIHAMKPEVSRISRPSRVSRKSRESRPSINHQSHDEAGPRIALTGGVVTSDGLLLSGREYAIPWWSGRVKDNFVEREAKDAITRFVPGREGRGWTDCMDSVVSHLKEQGFTSLHHHYGLWYDLRRTDHERVRRADGDVWAPFYEQPFARSGQSVAWDGLSRYDLSRPNQWYWSRLREFAEKAVSSGILLLHEHYFQHNILEAGAHWVDCPWRPVNNINGTDFPEPVPFAGDKRIFIAEQFYNEQSEVQRPLHRQYIRMCLEQLKDQPNVVHLLSAEYTGPLHFTRFWLQTIAEWVQETGRHPLIALSCTKDAQDSIMADPELSKVVDIIDIRYWHYNTEGLWAPEAGRNMAPRQWMRKMKVGKTGFDEVYRAVRECHDRFPGKAITYSSQGATENGWAVLFAGGSLPALPFTAATATPLQLQLLKAMGSMQPMTCDGGLAMGDGTSNFLVMANGQVVIAAPAGNYTIYTVDTKSGEIQQQEKGRKSTGSITLKGKGGKQVIWLLK